MIFGKLFELCGAAFESCLVLPLNKETETKYCPDVLKI